MVTRTKKIAEKVDAGEAWLCSIFTQAILANTVQCPPLKTGSANLARKSTGEVLNIASNLLLLYKARYGSVSLSYQTYSEGKLWVKFAVAVLSNSSQCPVLQTGDATHVRIATDDVAMLADSLLANMKRSYGEFAIKTK